MSAEVERASETRLLRGTGSAQADQRVTPSAAPGPGGVTRSTATRRRRPLLVVAVALGSVVYLLTKVWLSNWHHRALDFAVYMMGAHHLVDGRLYLATLATPPHLAFTYPPFAALALTLFVWIPFQLSELLWALASVASLLAIIAISLRAVLPERPGREILLWSLVAMAPAYRFEPVLLTFAFGQVNLVLCALVLADLTATPRVAGRSLPRGVLVGIAAAIKLVPLVFVPYLFLTRQVKAAWWSLATFLTCSLVAAAINPSGSWAYWTRYANDAKRIGAVFYISNQSLRGVADRVAHHVVSASVMTVVSAIVLVLGLALARWAWRASSNFLGVLVCATTGLAVSPISWAHHFVWAVPVVLWLAFASDRPAGGRLWAAAATAFFWVAPIWNVPSGGNRELTESGWQLLLGNSFFELMVLFLVGVSVMLTIRRHTEGVTMHARAPIGASTAISCPCERRAAAPNTVDVP